MARRRRRPNRLGALAAGLSLVAAACSSAGVETARSRQHADSTVPVTEPSATSSTTGPPPTRDLPAIGPVVWRPCAEFEEPFDCASIEVPIDYGDPDGDTVTIAMLRLPAARPAARVGALLLNPGGPGGSGIDLAWKEARRYPKSMLDAFDIIGFDPRGVGASDGVSCPPSFDPEVDSFAECIAADTELLTHLGTPNVARDMEMIRRSIGDAQISFMGYSYGTAVGALYADMFPDRVRAMVLDGAIDPDAGLSNTPAGGSDFYAEQDFDATLETFVSLCDLSTKCPAGPHTDDLIRRVRRNISSLTTSRFPGGARITRSEMDRTLTGAMYSTFVWPALAEALEDADNGDASTLAALESYLMYGYPADIDGALDLQYANIAIRCADFSNRDSGAFQCEDFPPTDEALPVITATETSTAIVVVGTKSDPATPARYSPLLAEALGDAVAIEWEGAGHTATLTSRCITDIVAEYLVHLTVPDDGTTCDFVSGDPSVSTAADVVFGGPDRGTAAESIAAELVVQGVGEDEAACVGRGLSSRATRRQLLDQLLGLDSAALHDLRTLVERACSPGGG